MTCAWVLLAHEAKRRGYKRTHSLRRFCEQRGVELRVENRKRVFVQPDAIDAAIGALPSSVRPNLAAQAAAVVADFVGGKRGKAP